MLGQGNRMCKTRAESPPPTWGRSGRGKPRFGVRQSSLASPPQPAPQVGGGGIMLHRAYAIALPRGGRDYCLARFAHAIALDPIRLDFAARTGQRLARWIGRI